MATLRNLSWPPNNPDLSPLDLSADIGRASSTSTTEVKIAVHAALESAKDKTGLGRDHARHQVMATSFGLVQRRWSAVWVMVTPVFRMWVQFSGWGACEHVFRTKQLKTCKRNIVHSVGEPLKHVTIRLLP